MENEIIKLLSQNPYTFKKCADKEVGLQKHHELQLTVFGVRLQGLDLYSSYLFVFPLERASSIHVLNAADPKEKIAVENLPDCTQYTGMTFRNWKFYIADQSLQKIRGFLCPW